MARSRDSAKRAGRWMQQLVAEYLAKHVNPDIDQRKLSGAKDRGDIGNLKVNGQRVVVEVKNTSRIDVASFLAEAEAERVNDNAVAGIVVAKRVGKGKPEDQIVLMTLRDFVALVNGERPVDTSSDSSQSEGHTES